MEKDPPITSSYFLKFVECLLVSIAVVNVYQMQVVFTLGAMLKLSRSVVAFSEYLQLALMIAAILFTIGYSLYWHRKEHRSAINGATLHAWFRGIIRYWLALEITTYGVAKIFKQQFGHSYLRDDSLVSSLSGFDLTWNYFGYSYALAVIIGMLQIGGSALLLFRRTTLLGTVILLPVMINILLIDIFYQIPFGATLNAALFTLGLLYLLLLRWKELTALFLQSRDQQPPVRLGMLKSLIRVAGPLFVVAFTYSYTVKSPTKMTGKWEVAELTRNGHPVAANAWLEDPTAWKHIYIEPYGDIVFSSNPYVIEQKKTYQGRYDYDSSQHIMHLKIAGNDIPITAQVTVQDSKHMLWKIIDYKDTTLLSLSRVEREGHD